MTLVSTAWNLFRHRGEFRPFFVNLTINLRCNARCPYCFQAASQRKEADMSLEAIKDIIDQLSELGCIELLLQGGEVLLREDIQPIIKHIRSRGISPRLVTNGILLAKKIDQFEGIDSIRISLDGSEDFNDFSKNTPGYYRKAIAGIRSARSRGIRCALNTQIMRGTKGQLNHLWQLCDEYKMAIQFLYSFPSQTISDHVGSRSLCSDEYRDIINDIVRAKHEGHPVLPSAGALLHSAQWDQIYGRPQTRVRIQKEDIPLGVTVPKCFAGRHSLHVEVNGDVWPCCIVPTPGANIFTDGSVTKALQRLADIKPNCVDCVNPPFIDMNRMFALHPDTILNLLRMSRRFR